MNAIIVVPAYRPDPALLVLVKQLTSSGDYRRVVIIDDGSGSEFTTLFTESQSFPGVTLLRHAVNLGKGAALKTGFNHVLCEYPDAKGVVTADADGQHAPGDIHRIAERLGQAPDTVVLGARRFADNSKIPWRSRFGNQLTIGAMRLLVGQKLSDTQTGLRGLPLSFLPHLMRIASTGYEFELDMLIACRHQDFHVVEEPVAAIYLDGNRSSHFNPLLDSARIYFVLLRFGFISLLTAAIDNLVFLLTFPVVANIAAAQITGRIAAVLFNYLAARRAVFLSRESHTVTLPRYLLLVAASGIVSYGLIEFLVSHTHLTVFAAKLSAEGTLFIANFAIQRDFVFRKRKQEPAAVTSTLDT
ncbi:MAG TPA: bifunctional glycosyltransferase family 2/GtrA family protein [Bryobacteraceae bacterium]|jgi:putative flippase GtrA